MVNWFATWLAASDIYLHDTYYVIGHFHYVVAPGTIFALFAGIYYWFPKMTGKKMSEMLGKLHFWPSLIFMNGIFMPMFIQGLAGVSRRLADGGQSYAHASGVLEWNEFMSISAFCLGLAQIPFIVNIFMSLFSGEKPLEIHGILLRLSGHAFSASWSWQFDGPINVYHTAYEYSVPDDKKDFKPQFEN